MTPKTVRDRCPGSGTVFLSANCPRPVPERPISRSETVPDRWGQVSAATCPLSPPLTSGDRLGQPSGQGDRDLRADLARRRETDTREMTEESHD